MVSNAQTMRSWEKSVGVTVGRFAATRAGFLAGVRGPLPAGLLLGFLGMSEVPENAALSGLKPRRKVAKSAVWQRCNWGGGRYSPREFDRTGRPKGLTGFPPFPRGSPECSLPLRMPRLRAPATPTAC